MNTPAVYRITNVAAGKTYVGSSLVVRSRLGAHRSCLRRGVHASGHLQAAWNRDGELAFVFEVIEEVVDPTKLIEREQFWIDELRSFDPVLGYNIRRQADSNAGNCWTEDRRAKMSALYTGVPLSAEHKAKIAAANKGRPISAATRAAGLAATLGVPLSAAHRAALSAATAGVPKSDEHRAKIGAGNRGKTRSAELRARLSAANKGKHPSEETRAKLREAWQRRRASKAVRA